MNRTRLKRVFIGWYLIHFLLIAIGLIGAYNLMYRDQFIKITHHKLYSTFDQTPFEANYLQPSPDRNTSIGIIFSHGYTQDRWGIHNFAVMLAHSGLHVVTMDYRGHGDSGGVRLSWDNRTSELNMNLAALDLYSQYKFLQEHGCQYIIVAGHSMGAFNSLAFAIRFPELVNATIGIGTPLSNFIPILNQTNPPNLLLLHGANDELFSASAMLEGYRTFMENSTAVSETVYGNFAAGTARSLQIIGDSKQYMGHVQEPLVPDFFQSTLDWINQTTSAMGQQIRYNSEDRMNLIPKWNTIRGMQMLLQVNIVLLLVPTIFLVETMAKIKREIGTDQLKRDKSFYQKTLGWSLIHGIMGSIVITSTYLNQNIWIPLSRGSEFISCVVGIGLVSWLLELYKWSKESPHLTEILPYQQIENQTEPLYKNEWRNSAIKIGLGLFLLILIPVLFELLTIKANLQNLIGGLPKTARSIKMWLTIISIVVFLSIPDEYNFLKYQRSLIKDSERIAVWKQSKYILLYRLPGFLVIIVTCFILNFDTFSLLFTIGFLLLRILLELISFGLRQGTNSIIPSIFLEAGIIAWGMISLLPFINI